MKADRGYSGMYVSNLFLKLFSISSLAGSELGVYAPSCLGAQVDSIDDQVREKLLLVKKGNANQLEEKEKNELKKRKLLNEV